MPLRLIALGSVSADARRREVPAAPVPLSRVGTSSVHLARLRRVTGLGVAALAAVGVIGGSWLSQRGEPARPPADTSTTLSVTAGDTLWSIAQRIAPARDPRSEVDALIRINHLTGADLTPGQRLRTR
jgi:Tfp pilus assembly protein FimV